jgi:DNA-binding transcriptional LysR family regulator
MAMFELKQILAFVHVAENCSFTSAAASLNLSQPTLSKRIGDLEESLGVKLLERTTKSVRLTDAGQRFLADARKILAQANRMELSARLESSGNRLLVGIEDELYPLGRFRRAFFPACARVSQQEKTDIRPRYFQAAELGETLAGCDVVIACSGGTIDRQRYVVTALCRLPLCLVTRRRPGYGAVLTRAQAEAEMKNARIVWYPRSRSSGVPMGNMHSLAGFSHPAIEWIDSGITALTCVEFDRGVAIMPDGHDSVRFSETLSYYALPPESGALEIYAARPVGAGPCGAQLIDALRDAFSEDGTDGSFQI